MFRKSLIHLANAFALTAMFACGGAGGEYDPEVDNVPFEGEETANTAGEITIGPTCATVSPDATLAIRETAQGYYFDHAVSGDTSYANGIGCSYFAVDMSVNSSYDGPSPRFVLSGFTTNTVTQTNCDNIENRVIIYRKTRNLFTGSESSWSTVHNETKLGTWVPAAPDIPAACDHKIFAEFEKPSVLGITHVYRVLVRPKMYGVLTPARAGWHWTY